MLTGVYLATKKDKTVYYRSNITHKGRHISLGSFPTEVQAHQAYTAACELLSGTETIMNEQKEILLKHARDGITLMTRVDLVEKKDEEF